ncbi:transposase domain-containing protein [Paracoccus sp. (in: a-proteobacteria)]|uniref:transposase domain-containing protein n=1 Tax=Paracoccus sp. TaxID=267 RepID=UPI0028B06F16|nr:transposase domain-containing protein [Paracoccus sp. (in: a-proteobacteria)]
MTPSREWWTPEALAEAGLPDLPTTKRRINALADREGWRLQPGKFRARAGRGGGWEYHWSLLPARARKALLVASQAVEPAPAKLDRDHAWRNFEELPEDIRAKARERLDVLQKFETFSASVGRDLAAREIARSFGLSARTVWRWIEMVEGVDAADWLAYLAPRHRLSPTGREVGGDCSEFFNLLKGDYLRLEAPSLSASYDVACRIARAKGLPVMAERTARRRVEDIPRVTRIFAREGERGLARCFPPQIRDRSQMVAMEGVNADCHKFDVFVQWDDDDKPRRAQLVAFQDLYSGKILAWRIDRDPNKVAVMSAFGELVETWGIPRHCLFDNGREFANKWLSGGTSTRFRFKVRDDDPLGVLPLLGIQIHWAKPAHGQAKPVERAFRDMAQRIAKDARFAGAYVGNRPDAKPENYMSRAIPLADFVSVVADGIEQHNARAGRQSPTCRGRSFDETFAESYATAPVRKATPEQRRIWLMGQEVKKTHATHGRIAMHKAAYWSDWMTDIAGQKVICRFDPEDLNAGVEVYALDGSYLGFAATQEKTEFFNLAAAQEHAALERRRKRLAKAALAAERPLDAEQVAAELHEVVREEVAKPDSRVVELVQKAQGPLINRAMPRPDVSDDDAEHEAAMILKFRAPDARAETDIPDTEVERWRHAKEIEARLEADRPVGSAEAQWLYGYQQTSEYRTHERMAKRFGPDAIG